MSIEPYTNNTRQRRICEYFGLSCTHFRTFLCLPPAVRHHIYYEADLVSDYDINLNPPKNADEIWPSLATFRTCQNLRLTCHTIHDEVTSIFYSTNRFYIRYRDAQNLHALQNLTPASLSSLTHLTIHLNVSSCEINTPCCNVYPGKSQSYHRHDRPLGASSLKYQAIMSEWKRTASHINAYINASKLNLHFVCDVEDIKVAERAIEPLLSTPTLADCDIRLGRLPNPILQDLAYRTVRQIIGCSSDQLNAQFRFLDLPLEIRVRILEYTDLVTPLEEVEWNPMKGFYLRYSVWSCDKEECYHEAHHRACKFRNCWEDLNVGCFCRRYHAAFSSRCHCWSPPTSLFLVCRSLRESAQKIFFMMNRFVVTPSGGCTRPAQNTPTRLEGSIFLTDIVPSNALQFLRCLELVFPPFREDYLQIHEPAYQGWLQTIDQVKEKLSLPCLTLRVYMADYLPMNGKNRTFRRKMNKEQGMTIFKMYSRTLWPLSKLNGLSRFFVHFAWPFEWTSKTIRRRQLNPQSVEQNITTMNQRYERLVMGNDYDSMLLGKTDLGASQWLEESINAYL